MGWLWVVGSLALLCGLVFASTAHRNLADIEISETDVTVVPRGVNKFWAFKSKVAIPVSSITSVTLVSGIRNLPTGLRLPGTAIPGLILAGTYVKSGEKSFYAIRDARDVVLLELRGHKYRRVGVQTRDPHAVAERLNALIDGRSDRALS